MENEVAAYKLKDSAEDGPAIICTDAECIYGYGLAQRIDFYRMTQSEVDAETQNRDGEAVKCASCDEILNTYHRTNGARG